MKSYEMLQLAGLLLTLLSVGWELFLSEPVSAIEEAIQAALLRDKLDQLHYRQFQLQHHLDYKVSEIRTGHAVHGDPLSEQWNPAPHQEDLERVGRQARRLRTLRLILLACGSVVLLGAKWMEYATPPTSLPATSPSQQAAPPAIAHPPATPPSSQHAVPPAIAYPPAPGIASPAP